MALNFKDAETERLAREVTRLTGESLTQAVKTALAERLEREHLKRADAVSLMKTIEALLHDSDNLPVLDGRTVKEILGYDENGLPG